MSSLTSALKDGWLQQAIQPIPVVNNALEAREIFEKNPDISAVRIKLPKDLHARIKEMRPEIRQTFDRTNQGGANSNVAKYVADPAKGMSIMPRWKETCELPAKHMGLLQDMAYLLQPLLAPGDIANCEYMLPMPSPDWHNHLHEKFLAVYALEEEKPTQFPGLFGTRVAESGEIAVFRGTAFHRTAPDRTLSEDPNYVAEPIIRFSIPEPQNL